MYELYFELISGVSVGVELVSGEQIDVPEMKWGVGIDLFIFRVVFVSLNREQ